MTKTVYFVWHCVACGAKEERTVAVWTAAHDDKVLHSVFVLPDGWFFDDLGNLICARRFCQLAARAE